MDLTRNYSERDYKNPTKKRKIELNQEIKECAPNKIRYLLLISDFSDKVKIDDRFVKSTFQTNKYFFPSFQGGHRKLLLLFYNNENTRNNVYNRVKRIGSVSVTKIAKDIFQDTAYPNL